MAEPKSIDELLALARQQSLLAINPNEHPCVRVIPLGRHLPYFVDGQATGFCSSPDYRVAAAARE